jgi:hypothetical protein
MKISGESQAVLLKYGIILISAYLTFNYVKSAAGNVIDLVKNVDLNPFDANGFLGLTLPAGTIVASGSSPTHKATLAAMGKDINNYSVWYPNPFTGQKMPAGTIQITWGTNKVTYYAPKNALDVFNF